MSFKLKLVVYILILLTLLVSPSIRTAQAQIQPVAWEQKGLTIRLVDQSLEDVNKSLDDLLETGANYVTITPGWHTDNLYSSNVDRKSRTPSDELLVYTIERSHEMGLKVFMKPHVDPKTGDWRAKMDPNDKETFFSNYKDMLLHYAELSQKYNVEQFSVGSELFSLSTNPDNEKYWRNIISAIKQIYTGKLTYNANVGDTDFDESVLPFWDMLDYIGFSMYQPLSDSKTPSLDEVLLNWKILEKNYIEPMYKQYNKPVIFTEIGYRSMDGAALDPGDYKVSASVDLQEQKLMYEALMSYWQNKPYMIGIHLWDWKMDKNPGGPNDIDYTPQNKPALEVLTEAFGGVLDGMTTTDVISEEVQKDMQDIASNDIPKIVISDGLIIYDGQELAKLKEPNNYALTETKEGVEFYKDRDYTISDIPESGKDTILLQTRNGDKNSDSLSQVVLEFFDKAMVFAAYDTRANGLPIWLQGWSKIGQQIKTTDTNFDIFAKEVDKGIVELGGNKQGTDTGARSNYFAFISKLSANSQNTDANQNNNSETNNSMDNVGSTGTMQESNTDAGSTPEQLPQEVQEEIIQEVLGAMSDTNNNIDLPKEGLEIDTGTNLQVSGQIELEYPKNAAVLSGERKIKIKIPGLSRDIYTAEAIVDGKYVYPLEDSPYDDIKQAKIQFKDWDWSGSGPYNIKIVAKDLSGNTIDTLDFKVFIKH